MKLSTIKNDHDYIVWFRRLVTLNPSELLILDTDTNPRKKETDIYFYIPCNEELHTDCGFFVWVLCLKTSELYYQDLELIRTDDTLNSYQKDLAIKAHTEWPFGVVVQATDFGSLDILTAVRGWINEWVEELSDVSMRMVDLTYYRKTFAHYEEFHSGFETKEMIDPFQAGQWSILTGKDKPSYKYSHSEIRKMIEKRWKKDK